MTRTISLANGCRLRQLSENDAEAVQSLLGQCGDYFRLHEGGSVPPNAAAELFTELPPGKLQKDKFVFGVEKPDGTLAGVVDFVRNFPEPGVWMLGLLLLAPGERGRGMGRAVHTELVQWAKALGARSVRIGVIEENRGGARFWDSLGYRRQGQTVLNLVKRPHTINILTLRV